MFLRHEVDNQPGHVATSVITWFQVRRTVFGHFVVRGWLKARLWKHFVTACSKIADGYCECFDAWGGFFTRLCGPLRCKHSRRLWAWHLRMLQHMRWMFTQMCCPLCADVIEDCYMASRDVWKAWGKQFITPSGPLRCKQGIHLKECLRMFWRMKIDCAPGCESALWKHVWRLWQEYSRYWKAWGECTSRLCKLLRQQAQSKSVGKASSDVSIHEVECLPKYAARFVQKQLKIVEIVSQDIVKAWGGFSSR